ncbi:MAG: helicase-related protein [Candidatus Thermoplasmatota archaeon]
MQPALAEAVAYDRLTGFFNVTALVAIADGLEGLWRRRGKMRLVLGVHDVPADLAKAAGSPPPEEIMAAVGQRLLDSVATLRDELSRNRIATVAWMMKEGLLQVRVAVPYGRTGIFHSKRLLFTDAGGDIVAASGSANETVPGMATNYEELNVFRSWEEPAQTRERVDSFEQIWQGRREDVAVRVLDQEFANHLLAALGETEHQPVAQSKASPRTSVLDRFFRESPLLGSLNLGPSALFPHQERAFLDCLGRWPVRALLADEVGLGKTLEAGAAIAHLLRTKAVSSVTILAPKNVMRQWQEEMQHHFGLSFWRYDSGAKAYVDPDGRFHRAPSDHPLGKGSPALRLVSAQLVRGSRDGGNLLSGAHLPDLMVVDEAHAARVRRDLDGTLRPTLLWRTLDTVATKVPHLLLLTATPVQLEPAEFHALLRLLGLPQAWTDPVKGEGEYARSLRVLALGAALPTLEDAKWSLKWLAQARKDYGWQPASGATTTAKTLASQDSANAQATIKARAAWPEVYPLLVDAHPASLLTIRNTRKVLEKFGYRFPERRLHAPIAKVDPGVVEFYRSVDEYLSRAYGRVEQAAHPDRPLSLGFARCSYQQRLASSLYAARISLLKRMQRLDSIAAGVESGLDEEDDDTDEDPGLEGTAPSAAVDPAEVATAKQAEAVYIKDLIERLDVLHADEQEPDPKMRELRQLLASYLERDQVLVFSRYTDTVDRCIQAFEEWFPDVGFAKYTGQDAFVASSGQRTRASKETVRAALEEGLAKVVFCSDAASEGLNLQAARVVINVDVPWNPARLEQRIGRVARLGQRAPQVDVVNLWYPNSVEARMYGRLMARREDYELAVGECPQIVADAIRNEVRTRLGEDAGPTMDPWQALQEARRNVQERALSQVWSNRRPGTTASRELWTSSLPHIARALGSAGWTVQASGDQFVAKKDGHTLQGSAAPGMRGSLTFQHAVFSVVGPRRAPAAFGVVFGGDVPMWPVGRADGQWKLYAAAQVPDLIAWRLGVGDLPVPAGAAVEGAPDSRTLRGVSPWQVPSGRLTLFPKPPEAPSPARWSVVSD